MKRPILILLICCLSLSVLKSQDKISTLEQSFKKGKSDNITALIQIGGGQLVMDGNSKELADVKLSYNKSEWNPSIAYTENSDSGKLTITAKTEGDEKHIDDNNKCMIHLNPMLTYSLGIVLGAGQANLDLQNFNISKAVFRLGVGSFYVNLSNTSIPLLKVDAGIGEATFDLSGSWKNNLTASINAGIGQLNLILPVDLGVKVTVNGFLGEVESPSYSKEGDEYTNQYWGKTKNQLVIHVDGAIGAVTISEK